MISFRIFISLYKLFGSDFNIFAIASAENVHISGVFSVCLHVSMALISIVLLSL